MNDRLISALSSLSIGSVKQYLGNQNDDLIKDNCLVFVGQEIKLYASLNGLHIPIINCNSTGNILESVVFSHLEQYIPDIEKGPKQASPDFWCNNRKYEYEQKCFCTHPCFDISNFESYIEQLCEPGGVLRKLLKTKYLIYEYATDDEVITIKSFVMLNVWNIVGYTGKYPITMQKKRGMWYNIRPSTKKDWNTDTKTPDLFINAIIKCIKECPNIMHEKNGKIKNIQSQYDDLKRKYLL